jgi:Protein of unknown function (DUF4197)
MKNITRIIPIAAISLISSITLSAQTSTTTKKVVAKPTTTKTTTHTTTTKTTAKTVTKTATKTGTTYGAKTTGSSAGSGSSTGSSGTGTHTMAPPAQNGSTGTSSGKPDLGGGTGGTKPGGSTPGSSSSVDLGGIIQTGKDVIDGQGGGGGGIINPSDLDMQKGLKDALVQCLGNSADIVSKPDGFFRNLTIKILFPPQAQTVESTLRSVGLGSICDDAIMSFNRAAEDASKQAKPIFINAITSMNFSDASGILLGGDHAATDYFKRTTTGPLKAQFKPVIQTALNNSGATRYWADVMSNYNKIPFVTPVNPDLADFVTGKAIDGLFYQVGIEEAKLRADIKNRTTPDIIHIFGWVDAKKGKK